MAPHRMRQACSALNLKRGRRKISFQVTTGRQPPQELRVRGFFLPPCVSVQPHRTRQLVVVECHHGAMHTRRSNRPRRPPTFFRHGHQEPARPCHDIQRGPTLSADCYGDGGSRNLWSNPDGQIPHETFCISNISIRFWVPSAHINLNVRLLEFCGFCWTTCALVESDMSSESAKCTTVTPGGTFLSTWARWLGMILVSTCPRWIAGFQTVDRGTLLDPWDQPMSQRCNCPIGELRGSD